MSKPNIKRRFADDDPSDNDGDFDSEEESQGPMRGGGKGFRMPGGKGLGKQLRYVPNPDDDDESDDSDDDDDDDEEDHKVTEYQPAQLAVSRVGGKQLRPAGGKQIRPP